MIPGLYEPFKKWAQHGSIWILSDPHFEDADCKFMDPNWITPEEQVSIINKLVFKNDTFICLGDVGNPEWIKKINARYKVLITGNHDVPNRYYDCFNELYVGPLTISDRILLSHEPVQGLRWCVNIHGHDHSNMEPYSEDCKYLNLAANVCGYTPVNLGRLIKDGLLSGVKNIHRITIDNASDKKRKREEI